MTREDSLIAMNGATLIGVADRLGVKCSCNKTRTALKEAKSKVVARILAKEAELAELEAAKEESAVAEQEMKIETIEAAKESEVIVEENAKVGIALKAETNKKPEAKSIEKQKVKNTKEVKKVEVSAGVSNALNDIYEKLNGMYFDGLLPQVEISVRNTTRTYDYCTLKKNGEIYKLAMAANAIGKPVEETAAILLHAMIHLYCREAEIVDTCQKGRYHNAKFKKECENRDLAVGYDSANGYVYTSPSEIFTAKLSAAGVDLKMQFVTEK